MPKTTITKSEYAQLTGKKIPSKMKPKPDKKPQTEIKMLQNEVAALWKAHTELLVLYNNIVDKPTEERS